MDTNESYAMPDNIIITLKTEKPGGFWPFVRGLFAWIGFGVVVLAGVSLMDTPDSSPEGAIEALQAYQIKTDTPQNAYSKAPVADPFEGIGLHPRPAPESERVCNPYDDHTSREGCALASDPANGSASHR
jgi:hypothetical protein